MCFGEIVVKYLFISTISRLLFQDVAVSLDVIKAKQKELLSDRDCLTAIIAAEDLMGLDQRLHLLDSISSELYEQVSRRRAVIERQLEHWSDLDGQCRRLLEAIAKCEYAVEGNCSMPIEQLIVHLQTVS